MANVKINGDTITIEIKSDVPSELGTPKTDTPESKQSENAMANTAIGIGKQVMGYIPGVGAATGSVNTIMGVGSKLAEGGATAATTALSLAVKLSKELYDFLKEYYTDRRQSAELNRRAGFDRRGQDK